MPLLCFNLRGAGRCAHKTPAIGGRFPHLRPEKCKLSRTWKSAKRRQWRMKRDGFEEVARLARPLGRGNRNATTVTSEKTIQIYFVSADAKLCEAFCCRARTPGQPLAALPLYGCRVSLAGKSLRRFLGARILRASCGTFCCLFGGGINYFGRE